MSNLIIVESPTKIRTIKSVLGSDYDVTASMGHVRDLPAARLNVDVKNDFEPKYAVIKGKEKLVKELQDDAKKYDNIYLATDPDREGEAIAWHLATTLAKYPALTRAFIRTTSLTEDVIKLYIRKARESFRTRDVAVM